MKNLKKGFTLIELLVVVAIIGILASVVLASLNTARAKGADAAVKADMANIRAQAEIWYDDNGNKYNDTKTTAANCTDGATFTGMFNDPNIKAAIAQIKTQAAAVAVCNTDNVDGQKWAISVTALKGGGPWCVDNSGHVGVTADVATAGVCS